MLTGPYNNPVCVSEVCIFRDSCRNWREFCQKKKKNKKKKISTNPVAIKFDSKIITAMTLQRHGSF